MIPIVLLFPPERAEENFVDDVAQKVGLFVLRVVARADMGQELLFKEIARVLHALCAEHVGSGTSPAYKIERK